MSFTIAARLLSWQTQEAQLLSSTTLRTLVRRHGQVIRQAEQAEAIRLTQEPTPDGDLHVVPHHAPRRRAGWPAALNDAVDAALAAEQNEPFYMKDSYRPHRTKSAFYNVLKDSHGRLRE